MESPRLVTPEAVALDLRTATVATRGLAALVDLLLQVLVMAVVGAALATVDVQDAGSSGVVVVLVVSLFLVRVVYPVVMETVVGATVGHLALGLRVVTTDGTPIRARQAMARVAVGLFELDATLGTVALLVSATRRDGRRLGDLAAGTQIVSTRTGTGPARALELRVPPHLAPWAAMLDTTGLQRPERTALRRYLLRADELAPERRDELAAGLADRLLPRLAVERPPAASAHDVLVAIAATIDARVPAAPPPPWDGGTTAPPA